MEKAILLNITDQKAWQTNVTLTNIIIILKNSGLHCYKDYNNFYFSFLQFREEFTITTKNGYDRQAQLVSADPESAKVYGVKGLSALNRSRFFHVVTGLLSDIMHDILEGVLPLHMKAMLHRFVIESKYFSLDELNRRLLHFPFGFTDSKNRPSIAKNLNLADRHSWSEIFPVTEVTHFKIHTFVTIFNLQIDKLIVNIFYVQQ